MYLINSKLCAVFILLCLPQPNLCFKPNKGPIHINTIKTIDAHLDDIKCTFYLKKDSKPYTDNTSVDCWGLYTHSLTENVLNYRCVGLSVSIKQIHVDIMNSVFSAMANIYSVWISSSKSQKTFAIHVSGGDASTAYWATINFKYIKGYDHYDSYIPTSRIIRLAEFPKVFESSIYHLW